MNEFRVEWLAGPREDVRVLKLSGPFVINGVFDFQTEVRNNSSPITIIDLTDVPYMDSAALGSILGLHVSCQKDKKQYGLVGVCDRIWTLLRVARVDTLVVVYSSLAEAESGARTKAACA